VVAVRHGYLGLVLTREIRVKPRPIFAYLFMRFQRGDYITNLWADQVSLWRCLRFLLTELKPPADDHFED
jgi:hypothetical protein